jgi:hypothetical protein
MNYGRENDMFGCLNFNYPGICLKFNDPGIFFPTFKPF